MHVEKHIDQQVRQGAQIGDDFAIERIGIGSGLGQLDPIERTFAGQGHASVGRSASLLAVWILLAHAGGDQRIGPQPIVVIQIFVPQAESINPLPDQIEHGMFAPFWIAMIGKTGRVPL
jgi:hypothetical protein